jgi:hypothetical protein
MSFTASVIPDAADPLKIKLMISRVATDVNKPPIVIDWGDGESKVTIPGNTTPTDVVKTYDRAGAFDIVVAESGGVRTKLHVIVGKFRIVDPETRDKTQQEVWSERRELARDIAGQMRTPS